MKAEPMAENTPAEPTLLSIKEYPLRWGDMDALGHLNNTLFFRFFEQSRVDWLDEHGWPVRREAAEGPMLVSTHCEFRAQVVYPGTLRIETRASRVGNSSFTIQQRMSRTDAPEQTVAEGESVSVWCDYARNASQPLPDRLRQLLTGTQP